MLKRDLLAVADLLVLTCKLLGLASILPFKITAFSVVIYHNSHCLLLGLMLLL